MTKLKVSTCSVGHALIVWGPPCHPSITRHIIHHSPSIFSTTLPPYFPPLPLHIHHSLSISSTTPPPYHPLLHLHIKMKVRRTHTHILIRVMTGQKIARNKEILQWGQLMSPPTKKIKDEKYKYFLANTYKHTINKNS